MSLNVRSKKKTVLVCDDEEMFLELIATILEDEDFDVLRASSGTEALESFRSHSDVDLVVTDLTMPQMDGKTLGIELKKLKPNVRIIYISGFSECMSCTNEMLPNSRYLAKPFSKHAFLNLVGEMLNN